LIIPELARLFWNYDTETLDMERSKELVILTTLARGTLEQLRLILSIYGTDQVEKVFRKDVLNLKTLPAPVIYLLGLVFLSEEELAAYKKWHEDPVLRWKPTRIVPPPQNGGSYE